MIRDTSSSIEPHAVATVVDDDPSARPSGSWRASGDAAAALAGAAAAVARESLRDAEVDWIKQLVLDSIGNTIAGMHRPPVPSLVTALMQFATSDRAGSTVVGQSVRLPAGYAALANGTGAGTANFHDTVDGSSVHSMQTVLWPVLALAETLPAATGWDVILAVAAGVEVHSRIGGAVTIAPVFGLTSSAGVFGAAAACAKLLGLDRDGIRSAMGLAYTQAAGGLQTSLEGLDSIWIQAAHAGHAGLMASVFASVGIQGVRNPLEGELGYFPLYARGHYDRDKLVSNLGQRSAALDYSMKPWPSSRSDHAAVEAAIELSTEYDLAPADIVGVTVTVPASVYALISTPFEVQLTDMNFYAANCVQWPVATALVKRDIRLDDMTDPAFSDETIRNVARKITVEKESATPPPALAPQSVKIELVTGESISRTITDMRGSFSRPMGWDGIEAKFDSLCRAADAANPSSPPVHTSRRAQVVDVVRRLDDMDDVADLMRLLAR